MLATVTSIVGLFTCVHLAVGAAIGAGAGIGGQSFAPPIPQPPAPPCGPVSAAAPCPPCAQGAAQKGPAMYSPPIWRPPPPVTAEDDVHCAARFADNLAGRSFQEELCAPEFDVVYTWVNGSDAKWQAAKAAVEKASRRQSHHTSADADQTLRFADHQVCLPFCRH